jgi:hypothetical protein
MSENAIFLSASVPTNPESPYFSSANPFLIQFAVRELITVALGRRPIVWGGHPAITPMIWAACEDLGVEYDKALVLYQSRFFEELYPEENQKFSNVMYVEKIENDRDASLFQMRTEMLSRQDLTTAVFIGGMDGINDEYSMFTQFHPEAKILSVASPGGAAQSLAQRLGASEAELGDIDFSRMFYQALGVSPADRRDKLNKTI